MGKWILRVDPADVHHHEFPIPARHNGEEWDVGSIWECGCGDQYQWRYSGNGRGITWCRIMEWN